ncbi:MAG: enoyl-CoA hydratase/isomerase family protein [Candidatus Nanopelagicales bacterium]
MTYNTLLVERPRPEVVLVRLNRPDRLNAITFEMFDEFIELQGEVDHDPLARVLVITGSGRAFCAGLDLDEAAQLPGMTPLEMLAGQETWARSIAGFRHMDKPVIAAVNGPAAGAGMGIALAADIRLASTTAKFNAAFIRIGLTGGDVGTSWMLPRLVGLGRAYEILLTGRFVEAEEALRIGLVTEVTEPQDLLARALATADTICSNSPVGVRLTKKVVQTNVDAPSLDVAIDLENRNQVLAVQTDDMAEALAAFREKRAPRFVGH